MRRFFQSLKSKLVLLIILVALPGLAGLIYHSFIERKNAINAALEQAINIVEITTSEQANLIEETRVFLQRLSTFKSVLNPESPECSMSLANILKLNSNYINLGIPRADGELLCNARPLDKPVNVADRPYIQQALATRDFSIGEFQVDRAAGVTSINFAYPVINPVTDETVGIAVAVVSLDWWSNRLSLARLPNKTVAYITDHEQKIIAVYPTNSKLLGSNIKRTQGDLLKNNVTLGQTTKSFMSVDNHLRMFVSRPLFNTGGPINITISVGIPFADEVSVINLRLIKTGIFILIFVILMFVVATRGIQKSVLDPLKVLLQSTRNLESGKNVGDIPHHGSTELVDLQNSFTLMANTRLNAEQQLKKSQTSLQKSESRLSRHVENTSLGCISWDRNLICTDWNKSAEHIFGYRADEAIGRKASDLIVGPDLGDELYTIYKLLLEQKKGVYSTNENITKNGHAIICEWHSTPIIENDGSVSGVASLVQDITEHRKAEEKLKLAASVFTHAREGIMITDASGSIVEVNDTFIEITGYSRKELIGQNPRMFHSGRQSHEFYVAMWHEIDTTGHWAGEIWNRRKNGEVFAELKNISAVYDENGVIQNYVAMCSDITLMKEHLSQLERNAHYDLLTNLPNRVFLADRLNQAMMQCSRHKRSLAVAFLDLDGFKVVNDTHGHDVGDELLIALSLRMKEALREGDTLARIGGDEFVAVLADLVKVEDCEPVLERLLLAASEPVTFNDTTLNVSASIGITLYPQDSADAEQLMRHADQAMYVAKQSGKNRYHFFDTKQDEAVSIQRESLGNIRSGLERREFVLHYQPKVNMRTGDVIGVEALIRWQHPSLGLLSPADFLPIVEGHTISLDMGKWVIDTALTQISQWKSMGIHIPISVNISAYQLQQGECATCITGLLTAHPEVDPSDLELEILETSALHDVEHVSTVMNTCMALGVKFSLDDFGTGYSSLTHLRRLPVDLIKIDQTFVRDMLVDSDDLAIIEGVIALAKSFKRNVIAEGVETIEHGTVLLQLGCDLAQGYGIARPMPADAIPAWMKDWKPDDAWKV